MQHALTRVLCANAATDEDLLQDMHARVYVADLPPKYNLHIIAVEGCEEGLFLREMLANPLGAVFEGSLDKALYRWAVCILRQDCGQRDTLVCWCKTRQALHPVRRGDWSMPPSGRHRTTAWSCTSTCRCSPRRCAC